jgi:decaprenylphospho-beta-D-erythro-pentofuranosid-2-ulose 2-reductase
MMELPRASKTVLILGARSDIALAIARSFAKVGAHLILAARSASRLAADAQDLRVRHSVHVTIAEFDVLTVDRHASFLDDLGPLPDVVVCAVGLLGDQAISERDTAPARLVMDTNYVAPALLLGEIANRMERRGSGIIVGISSVAGERGRASNYVYGSAKAGFTAFLSGLRARLASRGVRVITVKPGFVATRMTAGMKLPAILTAQPKEVADSLAQSIRRHRDVVYVRRIWNVIMALIRVLPEPLAKRLIF